MPICLAAHAELEDQAAKLLAKAVNCPHGPRPEPCNECACERTAGHSVDVLEIDVF